MLSSPFRILFFGVFPCVSHFASVFTVFCRLSTFCTCRLRLAVVFQLCAGMGGVDDVHANAACVFHFFCCITSQTLPVACEALVAASSCFTLELSTMQKPRVFEACQTKTSQRTPKIIKHKRRNAWYLRQFRKQKRNQIILLRISPPYQVVLW